MGFKPRPGRTAFYFPITLDAGWGQFFQVLEQCCQKRGVFFLKVDSKKTTQICPNWLVETGKKELSQRVHSCQHCGYTTDRDVAAAQVVLVRGLAAVGHTGLACFLLAKRARNHAGRVKRSRSPRRKNLRSTRTEIVNEQSTISSSNKIQQRY